VERRQRSIEQLINFEAKEIGRPETYWVDLDTLRQEHLDDITAIYCQVFNKDPEKLKGFLELEPLVRDITDGQGCHTVESMDTPKLDVRRRILDVVNARVKYAVRFGVSSRGEEFTEAVDPYLMDIAQIAKPLSQMELEEKSGPLFRMGDRSVEPDYKLTFK
jgi:hypothetical protein